jgi:hypothetical protein
MAAPPLHHHRQVHLFAAPEYSGTVAGVVELQVLALCEASESELY